MLQRKPAWYAMVPAFKQTLELLARKSVWSLLFHWENPVHKAERCCCTYRKETIILVVAFRKIGKEWCSGGKDNQAKANWMLSNCYRNLWNWGHRSTISVVLSVRLNLSPDWIIKNVEYSICVWNFTFMKDTLRLTLRTMITHSHFITKSQKWPIKNFAFYF